MTTGVLPAHLGIAVRSGAVPGDLPGAQRPRPWLQVAGQRAVVDLVGPSRIEVVDGRSVTVDIAPEVAATGDTAWVVQGWAVAVAMLQRGHLVVHSSAVDIGGAAVLVAGRSGAGKSTTALALHARGHRLLVDDVSTIVDVDGRPHVVPYRRGVNLTPGTAHALGIDFADLPPLSAGRGKSSWTPADPGAEPVPVAAVVVVEPDVATEGVRVEDVSGGQRIAVLGPHCDRDGAAPAILGRAGLFEQTAALAGATRVARVRRPAAGWHLDPVCAAVESVVAR